MDEQAKKKFLMKVGIISLMALILIFWVLNMKNVFRTNALTDNGQSTAEWQNMKNDFNDTISKMSQSLSKIEATNEKLKSASSSLVDELIIETNKIASSTATSSTATSTETNASSSPATRSDCPSFIDCMPKIGEEVNCQIPAGCEGITQIAY